MSDEAPVSALAPEVSPLAEADPNALNEFIEKRVDEIFNRRPGEGWTDAELQIMIGYYRKDRERFKLESEKKLAEGPKTRKKGPAPTSVKSAMAGQATNLDDVF